MGVRIVGTKGTATRACVAGCKSGKGKGRNNKGAGRTVGKPEYPNRAGNGRNVWNQPQPVRAQQQWHQRQTAVAEPGR